MTGYWVRQPLYEVQAAMQMSVDTGCVWVRLCSRKSPALSCRLPFVHRYRFSYNPRDSWEVPDEASYHALLALLATVTGAFGGETKSVIAPNAAFDKMKTLDGSWVGTMVESSKTFDTNSHFMMVSDGSMMAWLAEGSPYEIVTMFHMDGKDFMATHYCAAHNQPRLVAVPVGDSNRVVFKFKDGTNIGPHDGHMQEVTFIFQGRNQHVEEWAYVDEQGKVTTGRFEFKRKQ